MIVFAGVGKEAAVTVRHFWCADDGTEIQDGEIKSAGLVTGEDAIGKFPRFQQDCWPNVDLPVLFLDNDFRDPDLDEFLELVDRYEPEVAVIGDASSRQDAERYRQAATHLRDTYADVGPIIVPKCGDAFDELGQETVLGWPNGYAGVDPLSYSSIEQWRGRPIHVLGGMPDSQHEVIDLLTQPTIDDQPPADIVGLDGNGCFKAALYGVYWTPDGYQDADHLSLRDTVRRSLEEIKAYWQDLNVWPEVER